jgi:SHS2 domain-containing protein
VPGTPARIRQLDHTADVGVEVRAPTPCTLLAGGVEGMMELILGDSRPGETEVRSVTVEASEPRLLLRDLLREVLWLHEAEGFAVAQASVRVESGPDGLTATAELRGGPDPSPPVRELKGVTLHGLEARRDEDGEWLARVIFDV